MTIAEQIADRFNDGRTWSDGEAMIVDVASEQSEASWRWKSSLLLRFPDGSWMILAETGWDILVDDGHDLVDGNVEYWFTLVEGEPTRPGMTA